MERMEKITGVVERMEKITRMIAQSHGKKRYYTGKVCRDGHDCGRYTANGACCDCVALANLAAAERIKVARHAVAVEVLVHPDDTKNIYAEAKRLRRARGLV